MGSFWGAGPSRLSLTTTPALPYPILLTALFSFRMKKAGIDLPQRQFPGTLDPLKCLRPSLVALPAAAPFPLPYKNPGYSLHSVLLAVAADGVYFSLWASLWPKGWNFSVETWAGLWEVGLLAVTCLPRFCSWVNRQAVLLYCHAPPCRGPCVPWKPGKEAPWLPTGLNMGLLPRLGAPL